MSCSFPRVVWIGAGLASESQLRRFQTSVSLQTVSFRDAIFSDFQLADEIQASDLTVVSLRGLDPYQSIGRLRASSGKKLWDENQRKIVLRTQNSHRQIRSEVRAASMVGAIAIAHPHLLEIFSDGDAFWLPCAVERYSAPKVRDLLSRISGQKTSDVLFPFSLYRGEARNTVAANIMERLAAEGYSVKMGYFSGANPVNGVPNLWQEIASSRVTLNLPLSQDINIRTFEASLLPTFQVTNNNHSLNELALDQSNMRAIDPSVENYVEQIRGIIRDGTYRDLSPLPSEDVLKSHFEENRLAEIVERQLGVTVNLEDSGAELAGYDPGPSKSRIYSVKEISRQGPGIIVAKGTETYFVPPTHRVLNSLLSISDGWRLVRRVLRRLKVNQKNKIFSS